MLIQALTLWDKHQKIWITSDTHFNHKNIIAYESRPFASIPEMNAALIENWNKVVAPDDAVIHLGDFALGSANDLDRLVGSLNGHKFLILGNHDHSSRHRFLDAGFEDVLRAVDPQHTHQAAHGAGDGHAQNDDLIGFQT